MLSYSALPAWISVGPRPLLLTCSPGNDSEAAVTRSGLELGPIRPPPPPPRARAAPPLPAAGWPERIYLHISTFVRCRRPISARGEAGGLGGARAPAPAAAAAGSRAGSSRGGRAAHCSPSPGPPTPASARPGRQGQRGCPGGSARATFTCGCGNHRLQDGLRGLRVFQELPVCAEPALHSEYPEPGPLLPGALHLLGSSLVFLPDQRL